MASGLLALLDDVSALVKASAASLDDVPTQLAKTTSKVSGIVIDDTAVTPKYVVGLDPKRELHIIYQITKRSLINKLLILGPAALLLGLFLPWLIPYLLMIGGGFLCFEGYEKVHSLFRPHQAAAENEPENVETITPEQLEKERIGSAVRTDFILSAEIMAITFSTVADSDLVTQIAVMLAVAVCITLGVYGTVGLLVKMDDIGLHMAQDKYHPTTRRIGRSIVKSMPGFLKVLGYIGTAAMLWVGAEIIVHGIPFLHHLLEDYEHTLPDIPVLSWLIKAVTLAVFGIAVGFVIEKVVALVKKMMGK